jgi:putative SOS response-associated peptidase YedK
MCCRFTLRRDVHAVASELNAYGTGGSVIFEPRYNIAPTQQNPILTADENGRQLSPMIWGIPRSRGAKMVRQINARAEALPTRSSRCAVVTDGFYEWAGAKGSARQLHLFHRGCWPDPAGGPLAVAQG